MSREPGLIWPPLVAVLTVRPPLCEQEALTVPSSEARSLMWVTSVFI